MDQIHTGQVGLVSIGVPWFDVDAAEKNLKNTRTFLESKFQVNGPSKVLVSNEDFDAAIKDFQQKTPIDVLVLQIGTFPDGETPIIFAEQLHIPMIIHSVPEPTLDHAITLNSLCGANLTTYTLTALDHAHKSVHGDPTEESCQEELTASIKGALALAALKKMRLGLLGFRAPGFYPCTFDELLLRKTFGLALDHISLSEVTEELHKGNQKKAPTDNFPTIEGGELSNESVEWMERYYASMTTVLEKSGNKVFAIKDWPEIMGLENPGGIWPCLGWLQDDGYLFAPEGDVNGGVTFAILNSITGGVPFFADVCAIDNEKSALTLWHYGGAPSLAKDQAEIRYGEEGREVQFTLKPGEGTLVRLGLYKGTLRLLAIKVEMLDEKVTLRRAAGKAKTVNTPAEQIVKYILENGWEHHYCLIYSDVIPELEAISKLTGIPLKVF